MAEYVTLLSGGLDSAVAAHWLTANAPTPRILRYVFIDYGQPAAPQELSAAHRVMQVVGGDLDIVELPKQTALGWQMDTGAGAKGPRYVLGRNALLISLAMTRLDPNLSWEKFVLIGATGGDRANYPDCRETFIGGLSRLLTDAYGVQVIAPLIGWSREAIRAYAKAHNLGGLTWSCYQPTIAGQQCGECDSCLQ